MRRADDTALRTASEDPSVAPDPPAVSDPSAVAFGSAPPTTIGLPSVRAHWFLVHPAVLALQKLPYLQGVWVPFWHTTGLSLGHEFPIVCKGQPLLTTGSGWTELHWFDVHPAVLALQRLPYLQGVWVPFWHITGALVGHEFPMVCRGHPSTFWPLTAAGAPRRRRRDDNDKERRAVMNFMMVTTMMMMLASIS